MQPNQPTSKAQSATPANATSSPMTVPATTHPAPATVAAPPKELEQRGQGPDRRNSVVDRRVGVDRRQQTREQSGYTGPERRVAKAERRADSGLERRRGPGRRRSDDRKAAEEGEMTNEQFEFCMAIETYKKVNKKMFPTWTEVLEVITQLGYRKVLSRNIHLENCPEPDLFRSPPKADAA